MPKYTVETQDGQMEYGSLELLRQAAEMGLVRPTDMVREEGFATARPAGRVVERVGAEVKSATRAIQIHYPSPVLSHVLIPLALLALLYVELPRLTAMFPELWNVPGMAWLVRRPPIPTIAELLVPPPWAPPGLAWPADVSWEHLAAGALALAAFLRGLFSAGPQTAAFFGLLGGYFYGTGGRFVPAVAAWTAAAVALALSLRRALHRRRLMRPVQRS